MRRLGLNGCVFSIIFPSKWLYILQVQLPIFTNCRASSQEVRYEFHENFRIFWAVLTEPWNHDFSSWKKNWLQGAPQHPQPNTANKKMLLVYIHYIYVYIIYICMYNLCVYIYITNIYRVLYIYIYIDMWTRVCIYIYAHTHMYV